MILADFRGVANPLAPHFSRFRVSERLLLTGHSHQAWPDVAFDGQQQAWLDAAEFADEKWHRAAARAARVQEHWKRLLNDPDGDIALGQNTHELVTRLLSALPLRTRPKIVTTDGEFHTIRRQLDRLAEEGVELVKVPARPADGLADRVTREVDDRTAIVLMSSVLYQTAELVPGIDVVASACAREGAVFLVDAYHHLNVVPFDIRSLGLEAAFVTGGGYKYCQLGEGNGFLRLPPGCQLRPVLTGWFSEFDALEQSGSRQAVRYGQGAAAFAGATYDPTAHYRASAVFDFHVQQGLTPELLRQVSQHQVGWLKNSFEALEVNPAVAQVEAMPDDRRCGFLAIRSPRAAELCKALRERGVLTDFRGDILRVGPAPYLRDAQLDAVIEALREALKTV